MSDEPKSQEPSGAKIVQLFGEYLLDEQLAEGTTWAAYRAHHIQRTDERFLVRVLRGVSATNRNVVEAFARQAILLESLKHPGIVAIAAAGVDQGLVFIIKPEMSGSLLSDRIGDGVEPLIPQEISRIVKEIASVLDYLHRHRPPVVHRALEPSKILLSDPDQKVKVLEVGYVHALEEVSRVEALDNIPRLDEPYRAPEDESGTPATGAMDQYALAMVARACIQHTGALAEALLASTQNAINRATQKQPASRFPTVLGFATALELAINAGLRTAAGRTAIPRPSASVPVPAQTVVSTIALPKTEASVPPIRPVIPSPAVRPPEGLGASAGLARRNKATIVGAPPPPSEKPVSTPAPHTPGKTVPPAAGNTAKFAAVAEALGDADAVTDEIAAPPPSFRTDDVANALRPPAVPEAVEAEPVQVSMGGDDDLFGSLPASTVRARPHDEEPTTRREVPVHDDESFEADTVQLPSDSPPAPAPVIPVLSSALGPAVAPHVAPGSLSAAVAPMATQAITEVTPPSVVLPPPEPIEAAVQPTSALANDPWAASDAARRRAQTEDYMLPPPQPKTSSSGVKVAWILGVCIIIGSIIHVAGFMLREPLMALVHGRTSPTSPTANPATPSPEHPRVEEHAATGAGTGTVPPVVPAGSAADAASVAAPTNSDAGAPTQHVAVAATTPDAGATVAPPPQASAPPPTQGPLARHPSAADRSAAETQIVAHLDACPGHLGHHARIHATYLGPTGQVGDLRVTGSDLEGNPIAACIEQAIRAVAVPPFHDPEWRTDYTLFVH